MFLDLSRVTETLSVMHLEYDLKDRLDLAVGLLMGPLSFHLRKTAEYYERVPRSLSLDIQEPISAMTACV